jgi:hypothetical protein
MIRNRKASAQLKVTTSSETNNSSISEETKESHNMASNTNTIDDETCSSCEEEKPQKSSEILDSLNKIWETVPSAS